ncbi:outer membrane beta-barrel protein [Rhodocytophaga aerolata]|uniref:Outer membrane beta-barrel protein n=1 Tax=Rhodocytophaga aerolata TaxID=455078 RepID=A0ABT8RFL2_9BACT|nr:outer membrane beta-barrel protein [Rhodocytophaga aerolata]MDO1449502.1 outer membrane beta-barrel protein [Rhodocytophaga aerolata]
MKKNIFYLLVGSLLLVATSSYAQLDSLTKAKSQYKKFYVGIGFNNYWSSIEGQNLPEYFYKPSLGYSVKAEYYFTKFLGISAGLTYQQRGTGIINRNKEEIPLGGKDSTYRERLRFNYWDIPIQLVLRTPTPIKGGDVRLVGTFGIISQHMFKATRIFHSVEDGFHEITDETDRVHKNEIGLISTIGADIFAGATTFQVRLVGNWGTKNVFKDQEMVPLGYNGKNRMYGIQVGVMF